MSYPHISEKNFLEDLLNRKEFFSLKADPARNFRDPPDGNLDDPLIGKYLKIHSHQLFVRNFMNPNTPYKRMHLMHGTGTGKCHAAGTKILMYDGTIKNVEEIAVGDQVMGDDSTPRNVLSLASGVETMYKVVPNKGEAFVCNKSHILSLKCNNKRDKNYNGIVDISITDYLAQNNEFKRMHKLYRVGVEFPTKPLEIDPYTFGYWLGDERNRLATLQKHIPYDYKCNSHENRLKLLAGLIDNGGSYNAKKRSYSFIQNDERLVDDVIYLCRSLGFAAYKNSYIKNYTDSFGLLYQDTCYECSIRGDIDQIPVLLNCEKAKPRKVNKCVLSGFTLEKLPKDKYYGFVLDGNHRYLLGDFTVTHNTLAAISIAQEFIRVYRKMYASTAAKTQAGRRNYADLDRATPTVFVLGFGGTKSAFVRDLLKHPEFGFISLTEKDELIKRQKIADAGLADDVKHLKEYYSQLKKRITNKSKDGFYKFFGYDEFVNRLFLSDDVKLTDLEAIAIQKLRAGENVTLEDIIYDYIQSGKIQVNQQLLAMFEDSLLICDEIHNTYNMNMKNNRGVAIQFLLDSVPSLRFLSLSATPLNNSPTEVVELINYLVPPEKKVTKKDFFANTRTLFPGKINEIGEMTRGRISFLQDANIKYFPKRVIMGETLTIPKDIESFSEGSSIPYLKFIPCPMSSFHQATYNRHVESTSEITEPDEENIIEAVTKSTKINDAFNDAPLDEGVEEETIGATQYSYHSIPTDGYSIYDISFPNPDSTQYGIFRSSEVRNKIATATQEWRDKNKIMVKKFSAINNIITGDFLLRDNIGKYSTKCEKLVDTLTEIIKESGGDPLKCQKIMIYHSRVKMSGVLLLQELLRTNNFLDEHSEPVDSTICCICGKALSEHTGKDGRGETEQSSHHIYRPARFVVAHSEIDKAIMDQSLAKFNSPDNAHGMNYMILIGSKIIKESYDFKDIQNLIIMSLPINIPTLIQVFGRCIRKNSHINLPPEQRRVNIRIFISTVNTAFPHADSISPEMYRYIDKLSDYIVIQTIEREFNRNAIDADIHRDIIMPPDLKREYFPNGDSNRPVNTIGNLYFEPATVTPQYTLEELNLSTFTAYKYYEEEVRTISFIIKRLFMMQPVWTYEDLWAKVREPPIGIEVNPKLFSENNFIIALHNLVVETTTIISTTKQSQEMTETRLIEHLFDYNERYIYPRGVRHKIEQVGKYYILFPIADLPMNPLNAIYTEYLEHTRDKERAMIKELVEPNDRVLVDVETYLRGMNKQAGVRINIDSFVRESKANINYIAKKSQFIENYKSREDIIGFLFEFSAQFQMSFVEEAIIFVMLGSNATPENETVHLLYKKVIALLDQFRVIVFAKEIRKYKDTAKQYKNGVPDVSDDTPLGYMTAKSVRLFDPHLTDLTKASAETIERGTWLEVSKIALNRHTAYKENETIVGYLESAEDYMKFKLRKPVHRIKEEIQREASTRKISKSEMDGSTARTIVGDTRLIERGIVCSTKNKHELLQIIANLGISVSKLDKSEIRIKRLCEIIKRKLIDKEIKERQKDSRYKYLYSWWDESLDLASRI